MNILRQKQRALDARPIKKIAEAKARKKLRAARRIEKAMKKAEGINETTELSEKEKAAQIAKLVGKGLAKSKSKKSEVKLVVAKGAHKGLKGRPKGVKGRYKMVDSRMRKEVRSLLWRLFFTFSTCLSCELPSEKPRLRKSEGTKLYARGFKSEPGLCILPMSRDHSYIILILSWMLQRLRVCSCPQPDELLLLLLYFESVLLARHQNYVQPNIKLWY